jgi:hypothetical protein
LKIGSLQSFVESEGPIENFSCDLFSADEVHKIAILDLRMLNLDRNECNILVTKQLKEINDTESSLNLSAQSKLLTKEYERKLIPIDHGLSIPDTL